MSTCLWNTFQNDSERPNLKGCQVSIISGHNRPDLKKCRVVAIGDRSVTVTKPDDCEVRIFSPLKIGPHAAGCGFSMDEFTVEQKTGGAS